VLVLFFPSDIRFIHLSGSVKENEMPIVPCLTDPHRQKPRDLLRNANILPVQFHAGYALEVGGDEVDRYRPLLVTEFRGLHDGTNAYAEPLDT